MMKKGFTLAELLAVLIVLAIILAISIPTVSNIIRTSTMKAFESDAKMVLNAIRLKQIEDDTLNPININETNIDTILGLSNENYNNLKIEIYNNVQYIKIKGQGKWAGFSACGTFRNIKVNDGECANDFEDPVITLLGNNSVTINIGDIYVDAGATATDDIDGDITDKIVITGEVNINLVGTYILSYDVTDNSGRKAVTVTRTVHVIDTTNPIIAFGINGNAEWAKERNTTVTVSDIGGVDNTSLKYLWNTSTTAPNEEDFQTTFINEGTINSSAGISGNYYLWVIAKDKQGNTTIARTEVFNLDNTPPVITMNGSSSVDVLQGSTYTDAGATASDAHSGVGNVIVTGTVNGNVPGTYYIYYDVNDNASNSATQVIRTINVIDTVGPSVAFGTDGSTTWAKTQSSTVTVTDSGGVNESSLKYQWSTSTNTPSEASFNTAFANGGTISSLEKLTGSYYLWVLAKDKQGNTTIARTNIFNLDNTAPIITLNGLNPEKNLQGGMYIDSGATAYDAHSGIVDNVISTGTVNINVIGAYTITYSISDKAGNVGSINRTVNIKTPVVYANNYRIMYNGSSWSAISVPIPVAASYSTPIDENNFFTVANLYPDKYTYNGSSWIQNRYDYEWYSWNCATKGDEHTYYMTNSNIDSCAGNIFQVKDNGTRQGVTSDNTFVAISGADANTVFGLGPYNYYDDCKSGSIKRYTYNGSTWTSESTWSVGLPNFIELSAADANTVFAIGMGSCISYAPERTRLYVLKYNGSSWVSEIIAYGAWSNISVADARTIFATNGNSSGPLYQFKYNGSSWVSTLINSSTWTLIAAGDANTVFVSGGYFEQFRYNGSSWVRSTLISTNYGKIATPR